MPNIAKKKLKQLWPDDEWIFSFCDEDWVSGEDIERRVKFKSYLQKIEKGKFDVLFSAEPERVVRTGSRRQRGYVVDCLIDGNCVFMTPDQTYDPKNEDDTFMLDLLFSLSGREKRRTIRRMSRGTIKAAEEGKYLGTRYVLYGYSYDKYRKPKDKRLEIVEEEAKTVRLVYNMYAEGHSSFEISHWLNKNGYKPRSGKRFYNKFILDMLKNRTYIGEMIWNRRRYDPSQLNKNGRPKYIRNPTDQWIVAKGEHKHIIDDELFDKVQTILKSRHRRVYNPINFVSDYIAKGVLKCGLCNSDMWGIKTCQKKRKSKDPGRRFDYIYRRKYSCSRYRIDGGPDNCKGTKIIADDVEEQLLNKIREVCTSKELLKKARERIVLDLKNKGSDEIDFGYLKIQLEEIQRRQDNILDEMLAGYIAKPQFRRTNEKLVEEEDRLKKKIKEVEREVLEKASVKYNIGTIMTILSDFDRLYSMLNPEKKRLVMHAVIKEASVVDGQLAEDSIILNEPFNSLLVAKRTDDTKVTANKV